MSKGGGSSQTQTTAPYYRDLLNWRVRDEMLPAADQAFRDQRENPIPAGMETALAGLEGLAQQGSPLGAAGQAYVQDLLGGGAGSSNPILAEMNRIATGGDIGGNPHLDATYDRAAQALTRNFSEGTVPALDRAFSDAGRTGSGQYALLRGRQEEQLGSALGDMATGLYGGAYEADRSRQMGALGNLSGGALSGIGLGGAIQGQQAQPYQTALGASQFRQDQAWAPARNYAGLINPLLGAGSASSTPTHSNPLGDALGGGLGAAGMAAAMGLGGPWVAGLGAAGGLASLLSDARAKEDVRRVGKTDGGLSIFTYRYKGDEDGPVHMGVMAQEVAEKQPKAAAMRPDGLMGVFYDRVR